MAVETGFSLREHDQEGWEPDWITERFACFLTCSKTYCGEVVVVSGKRSHYYHQQYDPDTGDEHEFSGQTFYPAAMHPAPHIIGVSKKLNVVCKEDLIASFGLIWGDPSACANRIRTFIEHLLDEFGIPHIWVSKKGDHYKINLVQRIERLDELKPGHKKTIKALKHVGDYASHQGRAKFDTLIKCYRLLEDALADLVDGRKDQLDKLADELLAGDEHL